MIPDLINSGANEIDVTNNRKNLAVTSGIGYYQALVITLLRSFIERKDILSTRVRKPFIPQEA